MIVFFRTDLSLEIGTGHAMRCLSLSKEFKRKGIVTKFIFRDYEDGTRSLIEKLFPNCYFIESPSKKNKNLKSDEYRWSHSTKIDDAKKTKDILKDFEVDWLIIDHYSIDKTWENSIKKYVKNIMVIDDLFDRDHYCNALTDPSSNPTSLKIYKKRLNKSADLLIGNKYALIDSIYSEYRDIYRKRNFKNPRILIFFGGIDIQDHTYETVKFISNANIKFSEIDVVVGNNYHNKNNLRKLCQKNKYNLIVQTNKMHELMHNSDISIGSGGITTWERCSLGLPTFVCQIAKNQEQLIKAAAKNSLIFSPNSNKNFKIFLKDHLISFLKNTSLLEYISNRAFKSIDAKGCNRIVSYIMQKSLNARFASIKDSKKIFKWRNSFEVRKFSRNKKIINISDHNNWIKKILASKKESLIIVENNKDPVGVVRFSILNDSSAEISIYLVPKYIGKGMGNGVLDKAEELFLSKFKKIKVINANVLADNERSKYLFLKSKYEYNDLWFSKKIN
tara:strand:- start:30078 stop:31589 length:1512 start_codon:yes stop_codon:yes gene_type:complete